MAEGSASGLIRLRPFTAMTTGVQAWVAADVPPGIARRRLRRIFARVEARLTRFRDSELNRFCAACGGLASPLLFRALTTAARASRRTAGLFDPRVRAALEAWGYGPGLRFGGATPVLAAGRTEPAVPALRPGPWLHSGGTAGGVLEGFRQRRLTLPGAPGLDLGGIGKGLALRYGARALRRLAAGRGPQRTMGLCGPGGRARPGFLLDAGGDIWAEGLGPDGAGWTVGIAGPQDPERPLAVLRVAGRAVCTSSRGRRRWLVGGRTAHHLIDPRTGRPAAEGLFSVTVIGRDPAWAEVWSKTLFVAGAAAGPELAERRGLAAVFCGPDGELRASGAARRHLVAGGA